MIAADFFSGLGGFSEGARLAGLRPVFAANHWAAAVEWHAANHPGAVHLQQDLQQLDMRALPDLSEGVLLASPACQGHSSNAQPARAGSGGSHSPDLSRATSRTILQRSTAWAVVAAAEEARPRTILVENVPQFLGWTLFPAWTSALRTLGYHVTTSIMDASECGTPQARRRAVVAADLRRPLRLRPSLEPPGSIGACLEPDGPHHRWAPIAEKPSRMVSRIRKAQKEAGSSCLWNNVSESRGRPLEGLAPTLTTRCGSQLYHLDGDRCRILNPRELARLQGFPDAYKLPPQRDLAGRLIGNAIPVPLARALCAQIG